MNDENHELQPEPHDIWAAFSLLSRIPVPVDHDDAGERAAIAVWAFPIVGAVIGALVGLLAEILQMGLLPSGMTAALCLLAFFALTGAMHEDGLADCADGFWGSFERSRRLEIMRDSSVGVYGLIVLVVFLLAQWSAIEALLFANPIAVFAGVGAISRLPMVFAMWIMPNARDDGLSAGVGMPPAISVQIATITSFIICLIAFGWVGIAVFALAIAVSIPIFLIANHKIGGQTGDVLGASQKCAELGAFAGVLMF